MDNNKDNQPGLFMLVREEQETLHKKLKGMQESLNELTRITENMRDRARNIESRITSLELTTHTVPKKTLYTEPVEGGNGGSSTP